MPTELERELPQPEFVFQKIGDAKLERRVFDHDDNPVNVSVRRPPGGGFSTELSVRFEYGGYDCAHVLTLDRDATVDLRDALDEMLGGDDR